MLIDPMKIRDYLVSLNQDLIKELENHAISESEYSGAEAVLLDVIEYLTIDGLKDFIRIRRMDIERSFVQNKIPVESCRSAVEIIEKLQTELHYMSMEGGAIKDKYDEAYEILHS